MAEMWALTFDRTREDWSSSRGMVKERVPVPTLNESTTPTDADAALIKVRYAGFCGTDRGIWARKSFGTLIARSMQDQGQDKRVFGHEFLGTIVAMGSRAQQHSGLSMGDTVTTESHIVCNACVQCRAGQHHVCANEQILGLSLDGGFAELVKVPVQALQLTDLSRMRPEVAAVQEPFGNAVHACQATSLAGKTVAILGTGTIGLFAVLIARGMGAKTVIGVEVDPHHAELARKLGADHILTPARPPADAPWRSDPGLHQQILQLTGGVGVDVSLEMAGVHTSTNNALRITRRGGEVVLFGVRDGDATIEDAHRIVMNGLTLYGVVGRRLPATWDLVRELLYDHSNGIHDAIFHTLLHQGDGPLVPIEAWNPSDFEAVMAKHPKPLIAFEA